MEAIDHRLSPQWPGVELTRPYPGGMKAQVDHGRVVHPEQQTLPLHLTLVSGWGDVRITISFVVVPGQTDEVILGDKTSRETFGHRCHATAESNGGAARRRQRGAAEAGSVYAPVNAREQGLVQGHHVEVNMDTLQRAAGGVFGGGDAEDEVTIFTLWARRYVHAGGGRD